MDKFQCLFGMQRAEVKKTCVVVPVLMKNMLKEFGVKQVSRGKLYHCAHTAHFTLVHTGMGTARVGDAVLYLQEAGCQTALLFGSCGLVREQNGLSLGGLVAPQKCLGAESFSEMITDEKMGKKKYFPDRELLAALLRPDVLAATCFTTASLKLEEERIKFLAASNVDVVDMECSAFFAAAHYSGIKAAALLYIADVIKQRPFYGVFSSAEKILIESQQRKAIGILCRLVNKKLPD